MIAEFNQHRGLFFIASRQTRLSRIKAYGGDREAKRNREEEEREEVEEGEIEEERKVGEEKKRGQEGGGPRGFHLRKLRRNPAARPVRKSALIKAVSSEISSFAAPAGRPAWAFK